MLFQIFGEPIPTFEASDGRRISIDPAECITCRQCEPECPEEAIIMGHSGATLEGYKPIMEDYFYFDPNKCLLHGACEGVCPTLAITISAAPEGGDPEGDPDGSGGPGGIDDPKVNFSNLHNDLNSPCGNEALNKFFTSSYQNRITDILTGLINNANVNLTVKESASLPADVDGDTYVSKSGGYYNIEISLNANIVNTASLEFLVATLSHEILHAFFSVEGRDSVFDHNEMGTFYSDVMASALKGLFPNLSTMESAGISWSGIEDSYGWSELVRTNPNYAAQLQQLNATHRSGNLGTNCN